MGVEQVLRYSYRRVQLGVRMDCRGHGHELSRDTQSHAMEIAVVGASCGAVRRRSMSGSGTGRSKPEGVACEDWTAGAGDRFLSGALGKLDGPNAKR